MADPKRDPTKDAAATSKYGTYFCMTNSFVEVEAASSAAVR